MADNELKGNDKADDQNVNNEENTAYSVFEEGLKGLDEEVIEEDSQQEDSEGEEPEDELDLGSDDEESEEEPEGDEEELEEKPESEDDGEEYEPIPDDQVTAARMLGLSDEQIVSLAEENPSVLERMAWNYQRDKLEQDKRVPEKPEPKPEKPKPELLEHVEMDLNDMDPDMSKVVSQMLSAHNKLIDKHNDLLKNQSRVDEISEQLESKSTEDFNRSIDRMFDDLSENLPEVGNSRAMDAENAKLRQELFGMASILQNTRGLELQDAIEEAGFMWKMSQTDLDQLEEKVTKELKKKLNKNKKRMTPRPGGKKTTKKYDSPREAAVDTLAKGMEEMS